MTLDVIYSIYTKGNALKTVILSNIVRLSNGYIVLFLYIYFIRTGRKLGEKKNSGKIKLFKKMY